MTRTFAALRFAASFVLCSCTLFAQSGPQLSGIKRLYIQQFAVKNGSPKLRDAVIAQLRKANIVSVVGEKADADAVLTGDGEIWVKGYRSLDPRSGRLPSNATPLYSGFLSVELKDRKGDTLWSYLASPPASDNIAKDLSKSIEKHLAEALHR